MPRSGQRRAAARTPADLTAAEVAANFEPARLVQARHLGMLSRNDLANHLGVPAWQIAHWESAVTVPRPDQLQRIADLVEYPVAFFARGRPMAHITEADCHFRPVAYGR